MSTEPVSRPHTPQPIENAEAVIEQFGGIRPMAAKMEVAVTTVQGWKKRNVIPADRADAVRAAARRHQISLDGIGDPAPVIEERPEPKQPEQKQPEPEQSAAPKPQQAAPEPIPGLSREAVLAEINRSRREIEDRAVRKSLFAATALIGVFVVVSGVLIAVGKDRMRVQEERISTVVSQVKTSHPVAQPLVEELGRKFDMLRERTEALQGTVRDLKYQFENGTVMQRVAALESALQALTGGNADLSMVMTRMQEMQTSLQGQQKMQAMVDDLQKLVTGLEGRMEHMGPALMMEQDGDGALAEALQGVSPQELKAAAMLIGLSQFRDTMRRSGPFADDLAMLQAMLGSDDPELNAAIAALAPYAERGVLSPSGLSSELRGLAGDIVVASVTGQDLSVQERAMARFQDVLRIQKDGQPINANEAQVTVAQAQAMLDAGDIDGAIATLETLKGPARETAQPFIDQAEATRMAQELQSVLTGTVMNYIRQGSRPSGNVPYTAKPASPMGPFLPQMQTPIQPFAQ